MIVPLLYTYGVSLWVFGLGRWLSSLAGYGVFCGSCWFAVHDGSDDDSLDSDVVDIGSNEQHDCWQRPAEASIQLFLGVHCLGDRVCGVRGCIGTPSFPPQAAATTTTTTFYSDNPQFCPHPLILLNIHQPQRMDRPTFPHMSSLLRMKDFSRSFLTPPSRTPRLLFIEQLNKSNRLELDAVLEEHYSS
jgi:hypothetical protein